MAVLVLGQVGCTGSSDTLALWARALRLQLREQLLGEVFPALSVLPIASPHYWPKCTVQLSKQNRAVPAAIPGAPCCPHFSCCQVQNHGAIAWFALEDVSKI